MAPAKLLSHTTYPAEKKAAAACLLPTIQLGSEAPRFCITLKLLQFARVCEDRGVASELDEELALGPRLIWLHK